MRWLRFLFAPALPGIGLTAGARRLRHCLRTAFPPSGAVPDWRRLRARPGRGIVALALIIAGVAVIADGGWAQTIDNDLFAEEDEATRQILEFLTDYENAGAPVLGQMLAVFNGGVLLLAGFLLIWHTVAGSVDTAREGRWAFGAWEILRIVTAVALLAPLPGGMSGAQHIVMGLARLGGDFAAQVWSPLALQTLGSGRAIVPVPRERAWRTVLARTLVAETCMYAANAEARAAGDADYVRLVMSTDDDLQIWSYDGTGGGIPRGVCGSITFSHLDDDAAHAIAARGHLAAWRGARPALARAAASLGDHFIPGSAVYGRPLPSVPTTLDSYAIADGYRATIESHLRQVGDAEQQALIDTVADIADRISWLSAASFTNTLAATAGRLQAAAYNVPEAGLPLETLESWSQQADAASTALIRSLAAGGGWPVFHLESATGSVGALVSTSEQGNRLLRSILEFIDPSAVLIADTGNPILDLAGTGHALVAGSLGAMAAMAGVAVASSVAGGTAPAVVGRLVGMNPGDWFPAAWTVFDGIITPLLGALLIAGLVLAYLLPAIPFIRFLFAILAWLLTIVEAVLAVTIFAAAHVSREDGNRLAVSSTRQGWLFLPGLILRPPLMIFGLVLGYVLFVVMMKTFNDIWLPLMQDSQASGGLGPIDFVAMMILYVIIAYGLINACFKLIDMLPSVIMEWLGGRASVDSGADRTLGAATAGLGRAGGLRVGPPTRGRR